ncbi:MAG: glycosyltransferase 87 family protein [Candidatus Brocadiia bacterium]
MTPPDSSAKVDAAPSSSAILLVLLLYVGGTTCNRGFLSWWGLPLVLCAAALAFWFHARPRWNGPSPEALLTGMLIAFAASNCWLQTGYDQLQATAEEGWTWAQALASEMLTLPGIAIKVLCAAALVLAASYLSRSGGWIARRRFVALIVIAIAVRFLMMISSPSPNVDVFVSQTAGGKGLLEGKNVYQMKFPSPYKTQFVFEIVRGGKESSAEVTVEVRPEGANRPDFERAEISPESAARLGYGLSQDRHVTAVIPGSRAEAAGLKTGDLIEKVIYKPAEFTHFGYPPSVVYCNCISWLLFRDVRTVWVIFDVLAALLMYALARRCNPGEKGERLCQLLPLTFLFLPRSLLVIEQSWTEPLVVVSMAAFALAAESGRWPALTGALLGLWLGSKQYVVLAIPMLLKLRRWRAATWICAIAVGLALVLPFAIWDFRAMMENVLYFFLKSDARGDALSLYGFAVALGVPPSAGWIGAVVACLWIGALAWFTWKMPRTLAGMLFAAAGMWIFFFLLGKQAFTNYFYSVAFTLLLAVAATPGAAENSTPVKPDEPSPAG